MDYQVINGTYLLEMKSVYFWDIGKFKNGKNLLRLVLQLQKFLRHNK